MGRSNIINFLFLCFFFCLGCEERPHPLNFEHPLDPLTPPSTPQVVARWGNHMVRLDLTVSGEEKISYYRIYRKQSPN